MKTCPFCAEEIQDAAVVCKHCGRDLPGGTTTKAAEKPSGTYQPPAPIAEPKASKSGKKNRGLLLGLLLVLLLLVVYRVRQGAGTGGVVGIVAPARVIQIASAQTVDLGAGRIQHWDWDVTPQQPSCRVTGHVEVTAGGSRDVQVFVLTADDFANLANGHPARAFFQTNKTTAVTLDVRTSGSGPKVLAISNAFSLLTGKRVDLRNVQVICQ